MDPQQTPGQAAQRCWDAGFENIPPTYAVSRDLAEHFGERSVLETHPEVALPLFAELTAGNS